MRTTTLALLALAGCGDNVMTGTPDMAQFSPDIQMEDLATTMPPAATTAVVTTSSFMPMGSGTLNTIALGAGHAVTKGIDNTLDQDNDVFAGNGMVFVLDHTHSSL